MTEGKEIKLTPEEFDKVALSLTGYKDTLNSEKETIIKTNDNMKEDWLGDGGVAFMLSAKVVEEEFKERISDLEGEINDLKNAKSSMFGLDYYLEKEIKGAIDGITGTVEIVKNTCENLVNSK